MKGKLKIGNTAQISKKFSLKEVELFAELSLDKNPIHLDEQYAVSTIFKTRIVHGFLVGSLISAVIGTILPGKGSIYLHQDMDFKRPVYIEEEITAIVTITQINIEKELYYLETKCINSVGEIKIIGNAIIKYKGE